MSKAATSLLQSVVYTFFQRFAVMALAVVGFMLLVRIVSKELFGIYTLFTIVVSFVELAREGFLRNALVKSLAAEPPEAHQDIIAASLVLNLIFTLLCSIGVVILAFFSELIWNTPLLAPMLYAYALLSLPGVIFYHLEFIQQGNSDFKGILAGYLARKIIQFFVIVGLFFYPVSESTLLMTLVITEGIGLVVGSWILHRYARPYYILSWPGLFSRDRALRLYRFGIYTLGTNLSSHILKSIDQIMLGILISPSAVALYNATVRISNFVEVPTSAIAAVLFPESARRFAEGGAGAVKVLFEKSVGAVLAVLLPGLLFAYLFPEFIITVMAGKDYLEAVYLLQLTLLFSLFVPYGRQFGTMMDSTGKPKITTLMVIVTALSNLAFNYVFITRFGLIGAAYATLSAKIFGFAASHIILYRFFKINPLQPLWYIKDYYIMAWQRLSTFKIKI